MQSNRIIPDIYSEEFLNSGINFYLANIDTEAEKSVFINSLAAILVDALNVQRSDTEKTIKIARVVNHLKDFVDNFLHQVNDLELQVKLLFNLASYYSRSSELQLAKETFARAKNLFESNKLDNQELLSNILQTYGTTHIRLAEYDQAIEFLGQSLELRKKLFSPSTFEGNGYNAIHHTAISYASAYMFSERSIRFKFEKVVILMEAIENFEMAFKTRPNSTYLAYQIAEGYLLVGHYNRLVNDYISSEAHLNKSLELYNKHFPNGHIDLARVYNSFALVALEQGKHESAIKHFEQAIIEAKKIPGHNHHLSLTYYYLSQLVCRTNLAKAAEYMSLSNAVCKAVYGENHSISLHVESDKAKPEEKLDSKPDMQNNTYSQAAHSVQFKPAQKAVTTEKALTAESSPQLTRTSNSTI